MLFRSFEANKSKIMGQSSDEQQSVVKFSLKTLAEFSPELSDEILNNPIDTLNLLEEALSQSGLKNNPRIRFTEVFDSARQRIRNIRAKHLDQFIWVEGIVRQASDVRPQVVKAKFECPTCGAILTVLQIDKKFHEPSRCSCGWKGPQALPGTQRTDETLPIAALRLDLRLPAS